MKKSLHFLIILISSLMVVSSSAQNLGAKRYVLFEHFTNASCGPCASQNPVFEAFYEEHLVDARHLEIHTSWPGTDPMYDLIQTESQEMVNYYGVSGVPDMFANGTNIGGPASVNVDMLNTGTSPIRILVSEEEVDGTRNVTVEIHTVMEVPEGSYFLRVAVAEKHINYTTPPGNNGETYFSDVLRRWAANNIAYTPAAVGESVTFSYSYDLEAEWNAEEIYPLAYVVNSNTKEILNTGTPFDVQIEYLNDAADIQASDMTGNSFTSVVYNTSEVTQSVDVSLVSDHPADWVATFSVNGTEYTDMATIDASAGASDVVLNVTPGATAGLGRYAVTVTPAGTDDTQVLNYLVIHAITDLVAYNSSPDVDIVEPYTTGLEFAENTSFAALSSGELLRAFDHEALSSMLNLYLSIGWTFPALSDDLVAHMEAFLDNGGNLLIAGQDIGWDVMSMHSASNGTPAQRDFYTNYLHAEYNNDGSTASNAFSIVQSDEVFGFLGGGASILNVYGGANLYPDHVTPTNDDAHLIFTYNNDGGGGAIRTQTENYKVVYFGIGMEHVGDTDVKNNLIKVSHDWFYGIVSTEDFDRFFSDLSLGQNTPNPADKSVEIAINGSLEQPAIIQVVDITGKIVYSQPITPGDKVINLNTASFGNGVYFYSLVNKDGQTGSKKMMVAH
jgi:thiol-disulfide isomerase/thioredoxin